MTTEEKIEEWCKNHEFTLKAGCLLTDNVGASITWTIRPKAVCYKMDSIGDKVFALIIGEVETLNANPRTSKIIDSVDKGIYVFFLLQCCQKLFSMFSCHDLKHIKPAAPVTNIFIIYPIL